jgi:Purine catabolism regulatory protein-like family/PucR C-terminal helix-turn-helix domain
MIRPPHGVPTEPATPGSIEQRAPTLRNLLDAPGLGLAVPDGVPQDLNRAISWAHTTEMRDPARYLRGGELVCTVGISLQTPQDCQTFADSLARAGAAGVCFGIGDGHDSVPAALLAQCRRRGLPILIAAPSVPFTTVSRFVAEYELGAEIATARATNALVPELLSSLRRHESARELLDTAGQILGCYFLIDPGGAASTSDGESPEVAVEVSGLGTLGWMGGGTQPDPALLDLIARFVRATQVQQDVESALARERVGQLLSLVERRMLLPDALSQLLDWPGFAAAELTCSAWPAGAGALLSMALPEALVGAAPDLCLMLTAESPEMTEDLALPSGHAAPVALKEIGSAIGQARIALDLAQRRGRRVGPDQLSTLESLLEQLPVVQLAPFKQQLIDPLAEVDRRRGTQYVRTLRSFLTANGSLSETGRDLYLHTNTVRHRLARINELIGRDPLNHNDQSAFAIGLRAFDRED